MSKHLNQKLIYLLALSCLLSIAFLFWPTKGQWGFVLTLRLEKLLTLILISITGSVSTIIFQTISSNRLLTPSLMGMDNLYLLLQVLVISIFGSQMYVQLSAPLKFSIEVVIMIIFGSLLFVFLLYRLKGDMIRLLLIGVIFSILFKSLTEFIARLLDPTEYVTYQSASFAQINQVDPALLITSAIITSLVVLFIWRFRFVLDVFTLGRNSAINLGINYLLWTTIFIMIIVLLVALSTALVGPMLFFGLVSSAITYQIFKTIKHQILLPAAVLIAFIILVSGQIIFERLLHLGGTLSIAVECLGGLIFIGLILKQQSPRRK